MLKAAHGVCVGPARSPGWRAGLQCRRRPGGGRHSNHGAGDLCAVLPIQGGASAQSISHPCTPMCISWYDMGVILTLLRAANQGSRCCYKLNTARCIHVTGCACSLKSGRAMPSDTRVQRQGRSLYESSFYARPACTQGPPSGSADVLCRKLMRGAGCGGREVWGVCAGAGGASGLDCGGAQALHRARAPAAQDAGRRHAPGRRACSARSAPDVGCLSCLQTLMLSLCFSLTRSGRWPGIRSVCLQYLVRLIFA